MESKDRNVITNAINNVTNYLDKLSKDKNADKNDKAVKLSYWLSDYIRFLEFEEEFDKNKCRKYKRGDIIKVHLGFNIGCELGGLHYAVVIDKNDSPYSSTLTIVPLTSVKNNNSENLHYSKLYCGNAFYNALNSKIQMTIERLKNDITMLKIEIVEAELADNFRNNKHLMDEMERLAGEMIKLQKMSDEIQKMKSGSIALTGQITTVSKIRIYDPKSKYDVLNGISMPDEILDKIDDKIRQSYMHDKNSSKKLLTK